MRESILLQKYSSYLKASELSTATVDNYIADSVFFLDWLMTYLPSHGYNIASLKPSTYISYVDKELIDKFCSSLSRGTYSNSTVMRKIASLRNFLKFLNVEGYLTKDPLVSFAPDQVESTRSIENTRSTLSSFNTWLKHENVTDLTRKNYISDVRHLLINEVKLTPESLREYLALLYKQYSLASYKRKLASLRKFIEFMVARKNLISTDAINLKKELTAQIQTQKPLMINSPILSTDPIDPKPHYSFNFSVLLLFLILSSNIFLLGRMNTSLSSVIKAATGSLSNQSDPGVEDNLTVIIPFSAKLKDGFDIPMSYENDLSFSLYQSFDAVDPIYSTGRCPVSPNNSGIFVLVIGQDCGRLISYSLLQKYPEIYLGLSVGFGPELKPRIALKKFQFGYSAPTPTPTPIEAFLPLLIDEDLSTPESSIATE